MYSTTLSDIDQEMSDILYDDHPKEFMMCMDFISYLEKSCSKFMMLSL